MPAEESALHELARRIKAAREARGWTQPDLAQASGVSRPTVQRYEQAKIASPEPEAIRKVFRALDLDPREIPVILGYVTREEMGLAPEPARRFEPSIEEVIAILEDPTVPVEQKQEWIAYLRYRTGRTTPQRGRRVV